MCPRQSSGKPFCLIHRYAILWTTRKGAMISSRKPRRLRPKPADSGPSPGWVAGASALLLGCRLIHAGFPRADGLKVYIQPLSLVALFFSWDSVLSKKANNMHFVFCAMRFPSDTDGRDHRFSWLHLYLATSGPSPVCGLGSRRQPPGGPLLDTRAIWPAVAQNSPSMRERAMGSGGIVKCGQEEKGQLRVLPFAASLDRTGSTRPVRTAHLPLRSGVRCDSLFVIFPQVAGAYYRSLFLQDLKYIQIQGSLLNF